MPGGKGNIRPSDNPKPFKKGENGGGYPKGLPNAKTRLKRLLKLVQETQHPISGEVEDMSIAEQLDAALVLKAMSGDVKAYDQIMSRIEGKMKESIELTGSGAGVSKIEIEIITARHPDEDDKPETSIE